MPDNKKHQILNAIITEISKAVIGKDDLKELLLVALLSQGHVLIEGLPGTAKTTIARTFAQTIGGKFKRIQGTPDMLPADILGFYLYRPDGNSSFIPGPVFANVLLADELNRTTPRTQSALLEAMQEYQVTIERETHPLEQPFMVIASQIPYGGPGTSPLTEVQADRFMFRIWSTLPSKEEEDHLLRDIDAISEPDISSVAALDDIIQLQQEVKKVHIADNVRHYIINIIDRLRHHQDVQFGPSPRAGITLFRGSRALAFVQGRDFVIPDDIKSLLLPTVSHRLRLTAEAEMENVTCTDIINGVAAGIPVPKEGVISSIKQPEEAAETLTEETTSHTPEEAIKMEADTTIPALEVEAASTTEEAQKTVDGEDSAEPAPQKAPRLQIKAFPEWEWILIIIALVIAAVMISVGLLSFR